jgi:hypothetical protein
MSGRFLNALRFLSRWVSGLFSWKSDYDISQSKFVKDQSRRARIQMKKIFVIIFLLGIIPSLVASGVKVVYIPDNFKVEENVFKVTTIRNLSDIDIYFPRPINLIDDFIYLLDRDNFRVVKLSLQVKLVSQRVKV